MKTIIQPPMRRTLLFRTLSENRSFNSHYINLPFPYVRLCEGVHTYLDGSSRLNLKVNFSNKKEGELFLPPLPHIDYDASVCLQKAKTKDFISYFWQSAFMLNVGWSGEILLDKIFGDRSYLYGRPGMTPRLLCCLKKWSAIKLEDITKVDWLGK